MPRAPAPAGRTVAASALSHSSHKCFRESIPPFAQTFLDKKEVAERVIQVLKNFEKVDPAKVTPSAHFVNDLGLDSLDAVEVRNESAIFFVS
jgi:NADH dehydrogenase (ubiquinone) 1 alpha/beta subcomplex 1